MSVASKTMSSVDTFSKHGIRYDDHHFKDPEKGKYVASPPSKLKTLYAGSLPEQAPPTKVVLRGDINTLRQQTHCLGVYILMDTSKAPRDGSPNTQPIGKTGEPAWKHVSEDLVLAATENVNGSDGWVVAQYSSFTTKQRRCMLLPGEAAPYDPKREVQTWQEWDGSKWSPSTVKCRASSHGWGEQDGIRNAAVDSKNVPRSQMW